MPSQQALLISSAALPWAYMHGLQSLLALLPADGPDGPYMCQAGTYLELVRHSRAGYDLGLVWSGLDLLPHSLSGLLSHVTKQRSPNAAGRTQQSEHGSPNAAVRTWQSERGRPNMAGDYGWSVYLAELVLCFCCMAANSSMDITTGLLEGRPRCLTESVVLFGRPLRGFSAFTGSSSAD